MQGSSNTRGKDCRHLIHLPVCYSWKGQFDKEAGSFLEFTRSYQRYGINLNKDGDLEYREWAPNAKGVSLVS